MSYWVSPITWHKQALKTPFVVSMVSRSISLVDTKSKPFLYIITDYDVKRDGFLALILFPKTIVPEGWSEVLDFTYRHFTLAFNFSAISNTAKLFFFVFISISVKPNVFLLVCILRLRARKALELQFLLPNPN
jgi:hypothetical protein